MVQLAMNNSNVQEYVKTKLLSRLSILTKTKEDHPQNNKKEFNERGKQMFGPMVDKNYSAAFYELNLELLFHWSTLPEETWLKTWQRVEQKHKALHQDLFFTRDYSQQMESVSFIQDLKDSRHF